MDRLNLDDKKRKFNVVDAMIDGPQTETPAPPLKPVKPEAEDEVAGTVTQKPRRRSGTSKLAKGDSTRVGLKYGEIRFTFVIREDYEEKMKALAYYNRLNIKEMMDEIITEYMEKKKTRDILDEAMTAYQNRRKR